MEHNINEIVDLQTARILKKKGFNVPTKYFYLEKEVDNLESGLRVMREGVENHNQHEDFLFSAPTYKEATEWFISLTDEWELRDFDSHDWDSMHDCIFNASWDETKKEGEDLSIDALKSLFKELPDDIKADARRWGMSDTPWGDTVYTWYQENKMK